MSSNFLSCSKKIIPSKSSSSAYQREVLEINNNFSNLE